MNAETIRPGLLTSIGYGDQPWDSLLVRLRRHSVQFVIDVRSHPRSRQPEFNGEALQVLLTKQGIRYLFMGDSLGGKPDDASCYVDGRVDYSRCEARPAFVAGLQRLHAANAGGHRVALLCSELDPERCHRSKLIGQALAKMGVEQTHIDRDGELVSQAEVIGRLTGGQSELFGQAFTSVGRYQLGSPPEAKS